ncbi:MAG: HPr(Ser) kinase/phosphatase [Candidatus Cloacimonadaceae bacterium]|jgi:HPr kinase/phosphorylase|nr:HPr(Ser) kinase/phosphatase [Candidatus Cloacimonadota bacterium]MCB5254550.1 HPr(Ser) kinase/phosphatase [Candidatus Cloacimonadota bacterium]MCK9178633.1 HPr(Ser) kinase/phosphatase [Candidatus Cloacimonadota bacterium]MCK9242973.1 HPr(Ser) kinase/phosphatase [Candidatus Cloacimonadota bacterium]MDY0128201.1 HPr(Ser) kinase/phosphatase [Candidatus Cloacimonadaceae bacterium]
MKEITVREFFDAKKKDLALSLVTEPETLSKKINSPHVNRPGLALAGYLEVFSAERIQIFGETEIRYLQSLAEDDLVSRIRDMLQTEIPCIIVSKGLTLPPVVEYLANDLNVALLSSRLSTINLIQHLTRYMQDIFALEKTIHATLVDVFGQGILITGKSGIGKSECALDLIHRGHSLVGDDLITLRYLDDLLIGKPGRDFGHFMEIRGVGFVNVERMFGIERTRQFKTINMQMELMPWQENMDYERIGLTNSYAEHLGVKLPIIYLPVSPGKNVSVIVEVAAMNMILKGAGYDAAEDFNRKVHDEIRRKTMQKKMEDDAQESENNE